jgi:hypothetical protein
MQIIIDPPHLRHAARTYLAAGTTLREIRTRLQTTRAPAMPSDLLAKVKTTIDRSTRDVDEQIGYIQLEADALETRASLAEKADSESLLKQIEDLGYLDVPALGDQPPPDPVAPVGSGEHSGSRIGELTGGLYSSVVDGSYSDWNEVAGGGSCDPRGGGLIRGPDGRLYAITIKDGNGGSPLPGSIRPGPAGSVSGVGPPVKESDKWNHFLIALSGGSPPYGGYVPVTDPRTGKVVSVADVRSAGAHVYPRVTPPAYYWPSSPESPRHSRPQSAPMRAGVVGANVLPLVNGALSGIAAGQALDNQRSWGYQIDYYTTGDGGRRARLNMYQVHYDSGGQRYVTRGLGHFDADGKLVVTDRVTTKVG